MDKKTILGIAVAAVIFIGFAYFINMDQERYNKELAAYNEYLATQAPVVVASEVASEVTLDQAMASVESLVEDKQIFGDTLAAARAAEEQLFIIENDVLKLEFSTRGAQVHSAVLKDYTKYAPKDERDELVSLFDPSTAQFDLEFYIKSGLNNVKINTGEYTFTALPIQESQDGTYKRLIMQLPIVAGAHLEYIYTIYNSEEASRNYLVDFDIKMVNMTPHMANQNSLGIYWANTSYQNERGFQNENTYTTIAYRLPGDDSIDEMSMSDAVQDELVEEPLNWVAFKQQFFSSILIAENNFNNAELLFSTADPKSEYLKDFSARLTVPYSSQTESYDFSLYLGPNDFNILNNVELSEGGEELRLERLIPLGWGIFGWVNRWFVIPVFDFLRNYISSFGLIILILALLIRVIISPLTYKSYVSMAKMRLMKPQIDELTKKYTKKEDAMKRQQATMELYKKAGVNPMGGCIPMLIQMPIIIAMFRFFPSSIELRGQSFLWANDLSSYDSILNLPFSIPFYGDHVSLFAILMAIALFIFSYVNYQQTASSQPQMAGMKFMMVYMMPFMMLFWFNSYASGLCYYYFLSNILTIGQTLIIRRMIDDRKIESILAANSAKKQAKGGKKSKFQLRYEELMRQQDVTPKAKK